GGQPYPAGPGGSAAHGQQRAAPPPGRRAGLRRRPAGKRPCGDPAGGAVRRPRAAGAAPPLHPPGRLPLNLATKGDFPMDLKQAKALARKRLGDKRYHHTLNVEKMAVKLAGHYGADPEQAALAALLHDTAKEMPTAEQLALLRAHPDLAGDTENRPTPIWHGVCAAILARTEWGVTDEAVLSAVACHTAGKPGMTLLDKILFLADMTSAERDFDGVESLRRLAFEDIDRAMLA